MECRLICSICLIPARKHLNRAETFLLCTSFSYQQKFLSLNLETHIAVGGSICLPNSSFTGKDKLFLSKFVCISCMYIYILYITINWYHGLNIRYSSQLPPEVTRKNSTMRPAWQCWDQRGYDWCTEPVTLQRVAFVWAKGAKRNETNDTEMFMEVGN